MMMEDERVADLPPGFSFDPTDEELVLYYLKSKLAASLPFYPTTINIPHLDFSSSDPWELNERALWSKKQLYFFSQVKENVRATGKGYWKELHMNEPIILTNYGEKIIGIKKYFVYYINIHEQVQTDWIMEEFHLSTTNSLQNQKLSEWVLCKVHESKKNCDDEVELSYLDQVFLSVDDDQEEEEISFPC